MNDPPAAEDRNSAGDAECRVQGLFRHLPPFPDGNPQQPDTGSTRPDQIIHQQTARAGIDRTFSNRNRQSRPRHHPDSPAAAHDHTKPAALLAVILRQKLHSIRPAEQRFDMRSVGDVGIVSGILADHGGIRRAGFDRDFKLSARQDQRYAPATLQKDRKRPRSHRRPGGESASKFRRHHTSSMIA